MRTGFSSNVASSQRDPTLSARPPRAGVYRLVGRWGGSGRHRGRGRRGGSQRSMRCRSRGVGGCLHGRLPSRLPRCDYTLLCSTPESKRLALTYSRRIGYDLPAPTARSLATFQSEAERESGRAREGPAAANTHLTDTQRDEGLRGHGLMRDGGDRTPLHA